MRERVIGGDTAVKILAWAGALIIFIVVVSWVSGCAQAPVVPEVTQGPVNTPLKPSCCELAHPGTHELSRNEARATSYYPFNNAMEGGVNDRKGFKLRTLQAYLKNGGDYVSTAMDKTIAYGALICVPELEKKYGKPIPFKVVDTGQAFYGKGRSRIDFCSATERDTFEKTVNGPVTIVWCSK